jgi:hypothetical protein
MSKKTIRLDLPMQIGCFVIRISGSTGFTDLFAEFLETGCRRVLYHLMDLSHFQAVFHIPKPIS